MKTETEVKSAYDELTQEQREAILFSARLAQGVQAFNELAQKAYNAGRLAPSNPDTQH